MSRGQQTASRLTVKQVIAMREERAHGGWTVTEIAARYGVGHMTVSRITTGVTFPDLPGPISPKRKQGRTSECWRGHDLRKHRRKGARWQDCAKCHTIRNRQYRERKEAEAA